MRKALCMIFLLLLSSILAISQVRVITGKVVDQKGEPVPYASVKIKNATGGVAADANGVFKIQAIEGAILVVTNVGGSTKEITVGAANTYTITLPASNTELSAVVVTALGVRRSVKSTTFATQTVTADRLTQTREPDLTNALAGKVAGLQVLGQSGSRLGDAGVVRLRGAAAIADVYAIYVVDGTIVTNVNDINTDDIANVSVLKGPNATALYGQRAQGGVIVITTKKGSRNRKLAVEFNHTTTAERINVLPDYQNTYGGGNSESWKTFNYTPGVNPADWSVLNGKRYHNYSADESWGPRIDGGEYIPWYAWYPGSPYSFKTENYVAQPDNIRAFFNTGVTVNNNINLASGGDRYTTRFSITNLIHTGVLPESKQNKTTFSTQTGYDLTKKLSFSLNATYSTEKLNGDFNDDYSNFTAGSFNQWFQRDLNMARLKELSTLKTPTGVFASWNHSDPGSITDYTTPGFNSANFWYNPYTWLEQRSLVQNRYRLLGDVGLRYQLAPDWDIKGTYRFNYRTTKVESKVPSIIEEGGFQTGTYAEYGLDNSKYFEQNIELISTYKKNFNDISLDLLAGANFLKWRTRDSTRNTNGGLTVPDLFTIDNSATKPADLTAVYSDKEVLSFFGRATVGYKDFLFADLTLRQDYSSVLPKNDNGYLTPSAGLSFVFSDFVKSTLPELSYGKLRASWARIGTDAVNPYAINFAYTTSNIGYNNEYFYTGVPNTQVDPNLRPTINSAYEAGLDLRFFKDRMGLSTTYFYEVKKDDIVTTDISTASGFRRKTFNVGQVTRQGLELQLDLRPVQTRNFRWDVAANWSRIRSIVNRISEQTKTINLSAPGFVTTGLSFGNPPSLILPSVVHVEGEAWGQLRGFGIQKINGLPVLGTDGLFREQANVNFGTVLPNYTGGFFNQFAYKNFRLTATIDFQQGGKFFSLSDWFGSYTGLMARTAELNDNGVNVREPVENGGGVHVYGVNESGKPVDYYVDGKTYFKQFSDNSSGIADLSVFDATYVKLREVSLGYTFNIGENKVIKSAYISLVARNPWLIYKANPTVDPSELSDRNGEQGQLPGTRSLGINLKVGF
ncbi:SusC/RagA family TonB-linked outer membrane protein [Segetibacter sp. 3557_3]|uniref:SusC/RagA family TonB-linked outer membrane protein n=1 Tax=Segetibacter sp. 3557_3 TaxID=2547429 RepID=UPI0010591021|nr:SusC/RagA family TonB-linked outer membrane protein [Segetibacter sp. 3557_3]TDH21310.1 SusC/RagA family TonB-linked outer membrane protein [Segetibacter sp. 3557_3]